VGSWSCTQHAQPFSSERKVWPCCDTEELNKGCVSADHRPYAEPLTEIHTIKNVHKFVCDRMYGYRPGRLSDQCSFVRFDADEYQKRANNRPVQNVEIVKKKQLNVLVPSTRVFVKKGNSGLENNDNPVLLWNGGNEPVFSVNVSLIKQVKDFIQEETDDYVSVNVGKVEYGIELMRVNGKYGINYRQRSYLPYEFTPIEEVRKWKG
jgi:hypothetical protein